MKIGQFISGMLLVGLVAGLMGLFMSGLYRGYSESVIDYNDTEYSYDNLDDIQDTLNSTKEALDKLNSPTSNLYDKLSGFIGGTVGAFKTLITSVDLSFGLLDRGIDDAHLGASGILLKSTLAAMILLGLILAIITAYLKISEL